MTLNYNPLNDINDHLLHLPFQKRLFEKRATQTVLWTGTNAINDKDSSTRGTWSPYYGP
jgi:hypothetical protein